MDERKRELTDLPSKEIAKRVKKQITDELNVKVSVSFEHYSMGRTLHVSIMETSKRIIRNMDEIPEVALDYIGSGYTRENIEQRQKKTYHQLSNYACRDEYNERHWNSGVFLTEYGHNLTKRIEQIIRQYNYDNSDPMTDYFDVNFYTMLNIGKFDKPYILKGSD